MRVDPWLQRVIGVRSRAFGGWRNQESLRSYMSKCVDVDSLEPNSQQRLKPYLDSKIYVPKEKRWFQACKADELAEGRSKLLKLEEELLSCMSMENGTVLYRLGEFRV